jgi:Flp pilus assembly pilin Flp
MRLFKHLWRDEAGAILTAETVLVGSVAVLGVTVGLSTVATAVNDELKEVGFAIRSLDQSYGFVGQSSCRAWTAGSYYTQPRVEDSLAELCGEGVTNIDVIREHVDAQRALQHPTATPLEPQLAPAPEPNDLPEPEMKKDEPPKPQPTRPTKKKKKGKKGEEDV